MGTLGAGLDPYIDLSTPAQSFLAGTEDDAKKTNHGPVTMSAKLLSEVDWEKLALQANFHPQEMAAKCAVSLRHLECCFAARFQTTPGRWSRKLRFRLATEFIISGLSTKEVAARLGFTDNAHLCNEFKKLLGTTPKEYIRLRPTNHFTSQSGRR
jgi:transcriptional regulator GlxA family with amidase domain